MSTLILFEFGALVVLAGGSALIYAATVTTLLWARIRRSPSAPARLRDDRLFWLALSLTLICSGTAAASALRTWDGITGNIATASAPFAQSGGVAVIMLGSLLTIWLGLTRPVESVWESRFRWVFGVAVGASLALWLMWLIAYRLT